MISSTILRFGGKSSLGRWFSNLLTRPISMVDPTQKELLKEMCFVVDDADKVIEARTKEDCHIVTENGNLLLHRAFSVYLFDKSGDFLMQKRADTKITYPGHYSNTCCSHPLASIDGEDDLNDAIGIKRAAIRRLNYELGIPKEQLPLEGFQYLTRIKYKDLGDGKWGEHEIAYILIFQGDVQIDPNPNEVSAISYVPKSEFYSHLSALDGPLTPWFQMIVKNRLSLWWENLDNLSNFMNHREILELSK